jgi:hypothetical protein
MAPRPVSQCRSRLLSCVSIQEVTACLILGSVANSFASQVLLKRCKEMEITGPQIGTVERVVQNFTAIVL